MATSGQTDLVVLRPTIALDYLSTTHAEPYRRRIASINNRPVRLAFFRCKRNEAKPAAERDVDLRQTSNSANAGDLRASKPIKGWFPKPVVSAASADYVSFILYPPVSPQIDSELPDRVAVRTIALLLARRKLAKLQKDRGAVASPKIRNRHPDQVGSNALKRAVHHASVLPLTRSAIGE